MTNVGFGTLTELNMIPIDDSVIRVTVGATSDPPLKNPTRLFLISNRLDLQRAFSSILRPGEKILVIYEYNLDREFLESTLGSVKVSVTPSPPVDALMGSFKVGIELPFAFTSGLWLKKNPRRRIRNMPVPIGNAVPEAHIMPGRNS